ncbi:ABC transporter ATP-binding protein [Lichenihabitans sp. Uapishka_5]|nr:ABC transporter ATP-binding protein [Lichenihabitans sp. Uapishka_5]MDX7950388.1 ABC transporter ATP-binding protein [Lichenihabitans sp. Uapishka_5]
MLLRGLTKRFPGVVANADVDLGVRPGEIHALLGENGAGKSTLVKMIYGILQPDEGEIRWNGAPTAVPNPHAARALGIGMVFQHFSLFEALTVGENVALGLDRPEKPKALAERIRTVSQTYGLPLDPHRHVYDLSVGERQRIEIVRCLLLGPKLLIMDEPTSVLTPQEVDKLFETLRLLAAQGCSILYISHKLAEIKALCDRATILRGGRVVGACDPRAETAASMAALMIGAEVKSVARRAGGKPGAERLLVGGLDLKADAPHGIALKGISFTVRAGEVFGIAGVAGNGQNELLLALSGERTVETPGAVLLDGRRVGHRGAAHRRALGLCAVPEERNGHAAVPEFSLVDNAVLSGHGREGLVAGGLIRTRKAADFARRIIAGFDVRTPGPNVAAASLSGGNLQKFIVGREILQNPGVLVVSQPTWGVDAGAAAAIHAALLRLAAAGSAVVVISQDLDELLAISDRVAVINVGQLSEAMPTDGVSLEKLGLLMGGMHGAEVAQSDVPAREPAHAP